MSSSLDRGSNLLVSGSRSSYLWESGWAVIGKSLEYQTALGIGFALAASGELSKEASLNTAVNLPVCT